MKAELHYSDGVRWSPFGGFARSFWDLGAGLAAADSDVVTLAMSTPTRRAVPGLVAAGFFDMALAAATTQRPTLGAFVWVPLPRKRKGNGTTTKWGLARVEGASVAGQPVTLARIIGSNTKLMVRAWLPATPSTGPATRRSAGTRLHEFVFGEARASALPMLEGPRCVIVGPRDEVMGDLETPLRFNAAEGQIDGTLADLLALEGPSLLGHAHTCIVSSGADLQDVEAVWDDPDLLVLCGSRALLRWPRSRRARRTAIILDRTERAFEDAVQDVNERTRGAVTEDVLLHSEETVPPTVEFFAWRTP